MLFAAVLVPIVRRAQPTLIVVRRAAHLRRNPDQIAFPGPACRHRQRLAQPPASFFGV